MCSVVYQVSIAMVISVVSLALNMALVGAAVTGLHKEVLRTDNMPSSVVSGSRIAAIYSHTSSYRSVFNVFSPRVNNKPIIQS